MNINTKRLTVFERLSGVFRYDSELETYYIETNDKYGTQLYFYPEKYEFVTKKQYVEWKNNGVTPDTEPKEETKAEMLTDERKLDHFGCCM